MSSTPPETPDVEIELEAKEALKIFFWVSEFPPQDLPLLDNKSKLTPDQALWLFLYGGIGDWNHYGNHESNCWNGDIDEVLDYLYAYFGNPDFSGPDKSDLKKERQQVLYNYIVKRFPQPAEEPVSDIKKRVSWKTGLLMTIVDGRRG